MSDSGHDIDHEPTTPPDSPLALDYGIKSILDEQCILFPFLGKFSKKLIN